MTTSNSLPADVFGPADRDWNAKREQLQKAALLAAAELIAHTDAAGIDELQGFGVSLTIQRIDATN